MKILKCLLGVILLVSFSVLSPAVLLAQSDTSPKLTPELMSKMLKLISKTGHDKDLPANISYELGLAAEGQSWPYQMVTYDSTGDKFSHSFSVSRGTTQDVLVVIRR